MKITINKLGLRKDEVSFTSPFGEGKGIWCGSMPVTLQETYNVEFDMNQLLMRWIDILPASTTEYSMGIDNENTIFVGKLENIEEDGTAFLQMEESLIMFECLGEPMALGTFVEVKTSNVRIYDLNL